MSEKRKRVLRAWKIYSEHALDGAGVHVDAPSEGSACVDDCARVAVFYLDNYRWSEDAESLELARHALDFVLHMQAPDGEFYNFVNPDGTINTDGPTSRKSLGWWAARAVWALGAGYVVYREADPSFAATLESALRRTCRAIDAAHGADFGKYRMLHGQKVPAWLMGGGADISATALMGLCDFYAITRDREIAAIMRKLCGGIAAHRVDDPRTFPFGALLPWEESASFWNMWGARQASALARAGKLLRRPDWIAAAEEAANFLYLHLVLSSGPIEGMYPAPSMFPQIAFGAEVLARTFLHLHQSTRKLFYAKVAGLAGGWFLGNNVARAQMYDPETGKCFDGIDGFDAVSSHAGAESTISALMLLQDLDVEPTARRYLEYMPVEQVSWVQADAGKAEVSGGASNVAEMEHGYERFSGSGYLSLPPGSNATLTFSVPESQEYTFHVAYVRQACDEHEVEVEIGLDSEHVCTQTQGGSPDSDYLTMDMLPVRGYLDMGQHNMTFRRAGASGPRAAIIDCVLIRPQVERKSFVSPSRGWLCIAKNWSDATAEMRIVCPVRPAYTLTVLDHAASVQGKEKVASTDDDAFHVAVPSGGCMLLEGRARPRVRTASIPR